MSEKTMPSFEEIASYLKPGPGFIRHYGAIREMSLAQRNQLTDKGLSLAGVAIQQYPEDWGMSAAGALIVQNNIMPVEADLEIALVRYDTSKNDEHYIEFMAVRNAILRQEYILAASDDELAAMAIKDARPLKSLFSSEAQSLEPRRFIGGLGQRVIGLAGFFATAAARFTHEKPAAAVEKEFETLQAMRIILQQREYDVLGQTLSLGKGAAAAPA